MRTYNRSKFTNTVCIDEDCDQPRYTRQVGDLLIVMNTPFCESHAAAWSDSRARDLEASYGG